MSTNMADGNQQKHLVTEFCYKSVSLLLEELINIKVILFLKHEVSRKQNFPKKVAFFTYMTALSAVM